MLRRQAGICSQLQPEVEELKARLRAEGLKCRRSKKELLVKRLLSKASEPQESPQEAAPSGKGSSEAPQRRSLVCCHVFFPLPAPGKDCPHALCRSVGARASRQASSCNDKKTVVFPQRLLVGTDVFAEQLSHGIAQRPAQIAFSSMAEKLLFSLVREAVPPLSEPGLGGRWLAEGEKCEACGSTAGGWLCAGGAAHIASCEEASLFQGAWDQVALVRNGFLAVDARKHCVNLDGTCTMKKLDSSLHRIQQHLRAHGPAASHYWLRLSKYTSTLRIQRRLSGKMMAKPGPRPLEFRRRIQAFQRTEQRMSAGNLLQHMLQTSNERLLVAVEEDTCLRSGSVLLSMQSDGKVVLIKPEIFFLCKTNVSLSKSDYSMAKHYQPHKNSCWLHLPHILILLPLILGQVPIIFPFSNVPK